MASKLEPERVRRATELHLRAVAANNSAADPLTAVRLLHRAQAALGLEWDVDAASVPVALAPLVTRILITAGKAEVELYGLQAGLTVLARAEDIARRSGNSSLGVSIANQRGLLYQRSGLVEDALRVLTAAERDFDSAPAVDRCNVLVNRGVARLNRGELALARADLARCARLAAEHGLYVVQGMAEHNLGYAEFAAGDLVAALHAMDAAVRTSDQLPQGIAALDRSRVLSEAGLVREADATLAEAETIFARAGNAQDRAETLLERARCALVAADVAAARRFASRARDIFRRRGNDRWRRMAELVLLQGDLAAGRPGSRLVDPALRLRTEFDGAGLPNEARTATLIAAEAELNAGRTADAVRLVGSLSRPSNKDPLTVRLHDRYVRARLEATAARSTRASRLVRLGLAELADYQARFGSIDLQTASAVHGRRLASLDVSVALSSGRPGAVLAAAERGRAASNRLVLVRQPNDLTAAGLLAELRQVNESLHACTGDRTATEPLQRQRVALERAINARGWTRTGSGEARKIATVAQIRAGLGARTLVSYVQSGETLHAVTVGSHMRLRNLGPAAPIIESVRRLRADLDVLAQALLPAAMRVAVSASARRCAEELDVSLARSIGIDGALVIVTTGVLGQLPWGMLPSLAGVPVEVAPSATSWLAASAQPVGRRRRAVYGLAGPDVAAGERELSGVAAAWKQSTMSTDEAATGAALMTALDRGGVVHVAAHGVHNTENPLFSSLRLADGQVFAHEFDTIGHAPEHVVLSACELGLATVRPGDEAIGLTSVLLRLGTRSVVAGVARVGDEIAAETMIDYHRRLAGGADSATALAQAAATVDGPAPFVCFGSAWSAGIARGVGRARPPS